MGNIFGGGEAPQGEFTQPPGLNIPNEQLLTGLGAWRGSYAAPGLMAPYTTAQLGFAEQMTPQMQMYMPQFNAAQAMNPATNPWISGIPQNTALGAYQYVPPGANSMYNPQGNFQGLAGMSQLQQPQMMQMANMQQQQAGNSAPQNNNQQQKPNPQKEA